jgi:hypothetical protein
VSGIFFEASELKLGENLAIWYLFQQQHAGNPGVPHFTKN